MPDFFQKITEQQGTIEEIARKIPGFKGYLENNDRRDADRMLRETLVRGLEEQHREFTSVQKDIVTSGGIAHMETLSSIDSRMRMFIDRIESAAQGYAGLFDAVKVKAEQLDNLYAFDNTLLVYIDQFRDGLAALKDSIGTDALGEVIKQLDALVDEANNTFKRRVEAMQGLQDAV